MPQPDTKEPSLGSSWFNKPVAAPPPSDPAPASAPPFVELGGHPTWALGLGAVSVSVAIGTVVGMFFGALMRHRLFGICVAILRPSRRRARIASTT